MPVKEGMTGIAHIYASKNNTMVHVTDTTGAETFAFSTGGQIVKSGREKGKPYAAMKLAEKVIDDLKDSNLSSLHVRVRAPGGIKSKMPGSGAQAVIRTFARSRLKILSIEDVTPIPHDGCRQKGGRRGRRV